MRVKCWRRLKAFPHWRGIVSLCSRSTPAAHIDYLRDAGVGTIVTGDDHVDYRAALEELAERRGVKTIRVDSGGTLNGVMLRQGLVDESVYSSIRDSLAARLPVRCSARPISPHRMA